MEKMQNPFTWWVSSAGYEWQAKRGAGSKDSRSYPAIISIGRDWRAYQPPRSLLIDFCRLDPADDAAILAFANKWGMLGGVDMVPDSDNFTPEDEAKKLHPEPRAHWRNHIRRINEAVRLYMAIKSGDPEYLGTIVKWATPNHIMLATSNPAGTIADPDYRSYLLKRIKQGDLVTPAQLHLADIINRWLDEYAPHSFRWGERFTKLSDASEPRCLLGFLWLELATVISEGHSFANCSACGRLMMLISPERKSAFWKLRSTCSASCRVRKHEDRKRDAIELLKKGVPVEKISNQLGTDVEHIKSWASSADA